MSAGAGLRAQASRPGAGRLGLLGLAFLCALPFAVPGAYLLIRNLEEAGLAGRLTDPAILEPLARTLVLGAAVAAGAAVLGTALAWLVARTDVRGRRALAIALVLPLVLPSFVAAFALIAAFAPGGLVSELVPGYDGVVVRGFWAAFAVLTLATYPYVLLPVAARLRGLPARLEESARSLGDPPVRVFARVVLPQAAPAILAGALLAFLYVVSDFGAVQLLGYDTLTRAIYADRLLDQASSMAMGLVLAVLAVLVLSGERLVVRRARTAAPAPGPALRVPLGRLRWPAVAAAWLVAAIALGAPVAVLAYWAGRGLAAGGSRSGSLIADPAALTGPAVTTVAISVAAALLTVIVVLPIALYTARARGRGGTPMGAVVTGTFALPGLVVALSLVALTLDGPQALSGLYQTTALLLVAYVVHFGALALGPSQVAVSAVPPRLDEAARTLGAGRLRRLVTVDLPLLAPGLLAAGGLVLLSVAKELPMTLLLAPAGFETLATRIWTAAEDAFWADASLASLVLVAVSAVLTWLLVVRRADGLTR